MSATLLGLDIGTTTAKAVLLQPDGRVLATAQARYGIRFPRPGWAEQDPRDWWRAVCQLTLKLKRTTPNKFRAIVAVGVSGQGCPLVAVDAGGRCLRPAILWLDTRAASESDWLEDHHGDLLLRVNGNRSGAYNVEPKALWLREHEPEVFQKTFKFLTTVGYINFRLTNQFVLNHSDGGILFAYDLKERQWSDQFLDALGIPIEKYPPLAECHEVIGEVTPEAARETGLPAGAAVVAGGEDTSAAALAAGAVEPGHAYLSMGTAAVLGVVFPHPVHEPRLLSFPHVLPHRVLLSGSMSSGGASLEWYLSNWSLDSVKRGSNRFRALDEEATQSSPGSRGLVFLPYLSGELHPILDAMARGVFFGLSLDHRRADIVRSLMEGCAMAIRHNLSVAQLAGAKVREIFATGGPTRSAVWCQIVSDVTNCSLRVASAGAPEGDALLAGWGVGLVRDPKKVIQAGLRKTRRILPRHRFRERYEKLFGIYLEVYSRLKDQFPLLREIREADVTHAAGK